MKTLIADDHEIVREGLKSILKRLGPDVSVFECGSFPEALELAAHNKDFDLAVFDLLTPDMGGAIGVAEFCGRFPDTATVVLSNHYRRQNVLEILGKGAAGFIPKTLNSEAMLNAFRLALAGEKYFPAELLPIGDSGGESPAKGTGMQDTINALQSLSPREFEVLTRVPQGLPNKLIAKELNIQEVTVKLHLRNIYRKIGARNRAHAVKIALDLGWLD